MDKTVFIAQIMGPAMVVASIAAALNTKPMQKMLDEIIKSYALRFILGITEFIIGLTIVVTHSYWNDLASFLVSIVGWAMIVEGGLWVIAPTVLSAFVQQFRSKSVILFSSICGLVLGGYLIYFAYAS